MATNPGIIGLDPLNYAPYGAYAVNLAQTIWYWNPAAERITGHKAENVVGGPCYQVIQNLAGDGDDPVCHDGCPSLKAARKGTIPLVYDVWTLCASGQRKLVILTPLVIGATEASGTVLIHLFHEPGDRSRAERLAETLESVLSTNATQGTGEVYGENRQLTARELEVLRLIALGLTAYEIAEALHVSYHTVRNHAAAIRRKLGATNNIGMVRSAQKSGLL